MKRKNGFKMQLILNIKDIVRQPQREPVPPEEKHWL